MSIAIVSDTGCDFPEALGAEHDIYFVPLLFRFGLEELLDKSISMLEFLQRMEKNPITTSAPSPGDFIQAFRTCLASHRQVVCITLSSKHSASYASAVLASQDFPDEQVSVIDSASLSIGQGLQVLAASRAAQAGAGLEEIITRIKELQRRCSLFIALDTVKYLVRGGRASQLSGVLAGIFQIRPILTLVNGQLTLLERPRGRAASIRNMLKRAMDCFPAELIMVGHVGCQEEARDMASSLALQTGFPEDEIPVVETGIAIAAHGGPGTLGIVVVSKE